MPAGPDPIPRRARRRAAAASWAGGAVLALLAAFCGAQAPPTSGPDVPPPALVAPEARPEGGDAPAQEPSAAEPAPAPEKPAGPPIALVLPLSSPDYARAAEAVRDGFLAAADAAGARDHVRVYPHGSEDVLAAVDAARDAGCGMIITGTSRSEVAMRMDPGSTLRWLARHAPVPVLAVHDRVHGPYRHVCVASDYSEAATAALRLADAWFGDAAVRDLVHGYEVPLSTLSLDDGPRAQALQLAQEQAEEEARRHLAQALGGNAGRWASHAQLGGPVRMLREHARETGVDLTVIAAHGRSALMDRLIGSVADRLLETVGTDLLVVRPPRR